jgi:hypothetical protein
MRGAWGMLATVVMVIGLWGSNGVCAGEDAGLSLEERIASLEKQNGDLVIKLKILQAALKAYVQEKTDHTNPNLIPVVPLIYDTSTKDEIERRISSLEKLLGIDKYSYGRHTGVMFGGSIPDRLRNLESSISSIQSTTLFESSMNKCSCPSYIRECNCY